MQTLLIAVGNEKISFGDHQKFLEWVVLRHLNASINSKLGGGDGEWEWIQFMEISIDFSGYLHIPLTVTSLIFSVVQFWSQNGDWIVIVDAEVE